MIDKWPAAVGAQSHQARPAAGEVEHLEGARVVEQPFDVFGDKLFGADQHVDGQTALVEQLGMAMVLVGAHPGDLARGVKERPGHLTGHHVGLVVVGDGDEHLGIVATGLFEHLGMGGVAADGAQVEAVLEGLEQLGVLVHHGDVVGFGGEIGGHRGAHLPGAQNDDLHVSGGP